MKKYGFIMLLMVLLLITTPLAANGLLSFDEVLKLQTSEIKIDIQEVNFNIESICFVSNIGFITNEYFTHITFTANKSENKHINRYSFLLYKLRGDYLHFARCSQKLSSATHKI